MSMNRAGLAPDTSPLAFKRRKVERKPEVVEADFNDVIGFGNERSSRLFLKLDAESIELLDRMMDRFGEVAICAHMVALLDSRCDTGDMQGETFDDMADSEPFKERADALETLVVQVMRDWAK
jgi:hypothetical protein